MTLKPIFLGFIVVTCGLVSSLAHARAHKQHVHDHGVANLSIAVDGQIVGFDLDTPAQGIYGFEYAPKTDADKKVVLEANAKFTSGAAELFRFAPELGCKVSQAEIKKEGEEEEAKAQPNKHKADKPKSKETHSDLNAEVQFTCAKPIAGQKVTIALIKAFPNIKALKVKINSATKQGAESVTKAEQEVGL